MTLRPRATEIPELVRRLGSRRPTEVDAARERLSVIGSRSVDSLVEALDEDNRRIRENAMPLLALIQDPRGREPLTAMLLDRDPRMREVAARSLARFPSRESISSLERLLAKERVHEVRVAAVHGLIELYEAGQESALRRVIALLLDRSEEPRLRIASLTLLRLLRPAVRRGLLRTLREDPDQAIARKAAEIEEDDESQSASSRAAIERQLRALAAGDYSVWNEAVHRLVATGAAAVGPLVDQMCRRSHDPEYCARAGMVFKGLGPRRARGLAEFLDRVDDPLPLQVLVEVAGALGEKSLIYRLKDVIERVRPSGGGFDPMQRVRAKAHLELARIGSRVAIQDLREMLSDARRSVDLEILASLTLIGKKDEILDLLRAYQREDRFMRERIARVVRAIMKRERIRRNSAMFHALGADLHRTLETILPTPAPRGKQRNTGGRRSR